MICRALISFGILLALLWSVHASAQTPGWITRGSYLPTPTDHAGQDMEARSISLSAGSAANAVVLNSDARLCLNGSGCTRSMRWNSASGIVDLAAPLRLTGGNSLIVTGPIADDNSAGVRPVTILDGEGFRITGVNPMSWPTCNADYRGGLITSSTDNFLYQCDGEGVWDQVYTTRDGILPGADVDVPAKTFIAQNTVGDFGLRLLNEGCIDLGSGVSDHFCSDDNAITFPSTLYLTGTVFIAAPAAQPQGSNHLVVNAGGWTGEAPTSSVPTCSSAAKGGRATLSSSGASYYCDGTAALKLAVMLTNTASVDFAEVAAGSTLTATFTLTGAATGDNVNCNPTAAMEAGIVMGQGIATSADTITITVANVTGSPINPAAVNVNCTIVR